MRLEYNGDKTHVIMEAYAEHDYSFKALWEYGATVNFA